MGTPSQSYGTSLAIWDHTVLSATRHKWTRPGWPWTALLLVCCTSTIMLSLGPLSATTYLTIWQLLHLLFFFFFFASVSVLSVVIIDCTDKERWDCWLASDWSILWLHTTGDSAVVGQRSVDEIQDGRLCQETRFSRSVYDRQHRRWRTHRRWHRHQY